MGRFGAQPSVWREESLADDIFCPNFAALSLVLGWSWAVAASTWFCILWQSTHLSCLFVGPCCHRDRDYRIQSNFSKFYLIRTHFILGELVSLVKVFRLSKLEQMFFGVQSVDTVGRCTTSYLLAWPACLWRLVGNMRKEER